jgi:hypothetical protein
LTTATFTDDTGDAARQRENLIKTDCACLRRWKFIYITNNMPPLVRRRPLLERVQAYLDPGDFLLWLSEELNDDAHEDLLNSWATPIGIALNFLFILARGSSNPGDSRGSDDVFGDIEGKKGSGWFAWLVSIPGYVSLHDMKESG